MAFTALVNGPAAWAGVRLGGFIAYLNACPVSADMTSVLHRVRRDEHPAPVSTRVHPQQGGQAETMRSLQLCSLG